MPSRNPDPRQRRLDDQAERQFAARLQRVMRAEGWRAADLARWTAADPSTVSQWLTGHRRSAPTGAKLLRLLAAPELREAGINLDWLTTGHGRMYAPPGGRHADAFERGRQQALADLLDAARSAGVKK